MSKKTIDNYNKNVNSWKKNMTKINGFSVFHAYLEKPAIYGKLPNLVGKRVLCIGCGTGEEVAYLNERGPKSILGIDISEKMIELARKGFPDLDFKVMDIEKLNLPYETYDFVFSSLTMHYLKSWSKALSSIYKVLRQSGIFLFSINHPFISASRRFENDKVKYRMLGYKNIKYNPTSEIFGNYFDLHQFNVFLNDELTVGNYHRPLSALIKDVIRAGFQLVDIIEPKATEKAKKQYLKFWQIHQKIPEYMIFELKKI